MKTTKEFESLVSSENSTNLIPELIGEKALIIKVFITIGEDDKGNLFWDLDENKKPSETLHQTNDVFSKGSNNII